MLDFGFKYQNYNLKKIAKKINHLSDTEYAKLMYLADKANFDFITGHSKIKLGHKDYNDLKELADSMDYKRLK